MRQDIRIGNIFLNSPILFTGGIVPRNMSPSQSLEEPDLRKDNNATSITIVYDNYPFDGLLKTEWGFSCFVKGFERSVLFDTPGNAAMLLTNMQKLKIDPKEIDTIFLSHDHQDHTGGIQDILAQNNKAVVYLLKSFSRGIKSRVDDSVAETVEVTSPTYLCKKVATTGELGVAIKEQSLVLETEKGSVIITGCAHPGIVNIIQKVKRDFQQGIYLVLGGFHLGTTSDSELKQIVTQFRRIGVEKVGPCHCSGERCRRLLLDEYGKDFVEVGVGRIIEIE